MNLDRYEQIQNEGGFIASRLKKHVERVVANQYREMVLDGVLPANQSVQETTVVVRAMVSSYITDVLPDDVDFSDIGLFV